MKVLSSMYLLFTYTGGLVFVQFPSNRTWTNKTTTNIDTNMRTTTISQITFIYI